MPKASPETTVYETGQIRTLYKSLTDQAEKEHRLKPESNEEDVKAEAKKLMRERGEFLEKYNPVAHKKVLELRERARSIKTHEKIMKEADELAREGNYSEAALRRGEADDYEMGDYSQAVREAISVFNEGYEEALRRFADQAAAKKAEAAPRAQVEEIKAKKDEIKQMFEKKEAAIPVAAHRSDAQPIFKTKSSFRENVFKKAKDWSARVSETVKGWWPKPREQKSRPVQENEASQNISRRELITKIFDKTKKVIVSLPDQLKTTPHEVATRPRKLPERPVKNTEKKEEEVASTK